MFSYERTHIFRTILICVAWTCCLVRFSFAADPPTPTTANAIVNVASDRGVPVADAKVSIHLWRGFWEQTGIQATTSQTGAAELAGIPAGKYLTVVVEADGFAPVCQDMELGVEEQRTVIFKLAAPTLGTVHVLDKNGDPIEGVVLSELSYKDSYGNAYFHRSGGNSPFAFEPSVSDADGVIKLPAMPKGAIVSLKTFHEDFIASKLENIEIDNTEIGVLGLSSGVKLRIDLVAGEGLDQVPENLDVLLYMRPRDEDQRSVTSVHHRLSTTSNVIRANINAAKYSIFELRSKDEAYTITPMVDWRSQSFGQMMNVLADSKVHEVQFLVRKNEIVRGRLVGELEGIESVGISGWTENLHPTMESVAKADAWIPTAYSEADKDGFYELRLPPGKAKVSVSGLSGRKIEPSEVDFTVTAGTDSVAPEMTVRKIKNISGIVLDENQKPIANAIVRVCPGVWGGGYVRTDASGSFELSPDLILETGGYMKDFIVSLVAFDPASDRAAYVSIADTWRDGTEIVVNCKPRENGWLMAHLERQVADARQKINSTLKNETAQEKQDRLESLSAGLPGNQTPDLAEGTWINAQGTGLDQFKGKYVLLDFWFIGCGPCKADLPSVRLCQELFGGESFSVVSVHVTDQSVQNVAQYANVNEMNYPVVIDNIRGEIAEAYRSLGVTGFPSYLLLDPEGKIVYNDAPGDGPSLRNFKVERVWEAVRESRE